MNENELFKLRNALPFRYAPVLAEITGFSISQVKKNLNGERFNKEIISAALEMAEEAKIIKDGLLERVAKL